MLRRVKRNVNRQRPSVFIGKVGGPYPAPPPASNINLPSMGQDQGAPYYNGDYMDRGLDDYNALHYYGLDGLDNIDF